jgi:signal transduction histidine kinase
MKKYLLFYIIMCASVLAGFLTYAALAAIPARQETDAAAVNEITSRAALNWGDIEALRGYNFAYGFSIINNSGGSLYSTGADMPDNLQAAVRRGFLPMDISVNGETVGKTLIETLPERYIAQTRRALLGSFAAAFALIYACGAAFYISICATLVQPFRRLEAFAHKISTGRFDEPLPAEKNNLFGLLTQSFDIMRASLLEARQKQISAERAERELVASLSHDIKTPITSIRLVTELLLAGGTEPATADKLTTIISKTDQVDRLVNDLMHSSLNELGELNVNPTVESSEILRGLIIRSDPLSKVRLGDIPRCLIAVDPVRLEQTFGNIIANAYKYAGTIIEIQCAVVNDMFRVDIGDYGGGVEAESLELILTKFFRGANAKALHKEGEGLGLYISKQLMEKTGGGLEVYNRADGFTVRLWLPLAR